MALKIFVLLLALFGFAVSSEAQINYENRRRLNDGWEFRRGDLGNIWESVRVSGAGSPESVPLWEEVTLPHCFNATDAVAPFDNYYQGIGWYRTNLKVDNPYQNGRTILHFEGAGQKSEVYVYMTKVGSHVGGYDEWSVDITDAVAEFLNSEDAERFEGRVPIMIKCDNSRDVEIIPSDMSDFNLYGGIYRYLNLVYTPEDAITSLRLDSDVDAKGRRGALQVTANVNSTKPYTLEIKVFSPEDRLIASHSESGSREGSIEYSVEVKKPSIWSTTEPNLYRCEVTLKSDNSEMKSEDYFGFRHFEFVEHGPFKLNGERLLLRGTHRHEDHAGVGAAMTEEMIIREMNMMKEMGVNFIRLGHYQQSRIVLEQCDKLGILVWEEIPWCRGGLGGAEYQAQAKRMLTNMITQHRNHPSVILWGLGNENDWPNDFPYYSKEDIRVFMKELHDLSHSLDDSRLTAIRRCAFCKDIVDVYSPSIWAGWYRGIYTDYKDVSYAEMQDVKHFLHVEWGGDSHARRHTEDSYINIGEIESGEADERGSDASLYGGTPRVSRDGSWGESYICDLIDWHLKEQESMDWLTGAAYWPFKDFSTPLRPDNPVPYMNQKGVIERDFTPKESFYVFQSYWIDEPMVRIYGHTWPIRWGEEGENRVIKVYSNCDSAELIFNGENLGTKKRNSQNFPAAGLRWIVRPEKGVNSVQAIAYKNGERVVDELTFEYETRKWGEPSALKVSIEEGADGWVWIEAQLVDKSGVPCLDSDNYITFDSTGDGELLIDQGTSTGSSYLQSYNGRAKVKLNKNGGETVVSVKSEGAETVFVTVK